MKWIKSRNIFDSKQEDQNLLEYAKDFMIRIYKGERWGHLSYDDMEERVLDFVNTDFPYGLKNIPNPLILYRMLNVKSAEEINKYNLGKHYVGDKEIFEDWDFLQSAQLDYDIKKLFIVTIKTTPDNLDIDNILGNRAEYPSEHEYTILSDHNLDIINIEEYKTS